MDLNKRFLESVEFEFAYQHYLEKHKKKFLLEENIRNFVDDCFLYLPEKETRASDIHNTYNEWSKEKNVFAVDKNTLGIELKKMLDWKRKTNGIYYLGVDIK